MAFLGAHISIAGGLERAIERGESLECRAIQIFSKNQRQWKSPPLNEETAGRFRTALRSSSITVVLVHDSYLINLAHPDPQLRQRSLEAFIDEIDRAELLGIDFLVFHPGSHLEDGEKRGIERVCESLNRALERNKQGRVGLLVETTAGQGSNLGCNFEQISRILSGLENQNRMGVCFDTAHVFESGYPLRTREDYESTLQEFDQLIGLGRLKAFHLNDSKTDHASRRDRHENIGEGEIGAEFFSLLVNDVRFYGHPMILETPGGEECFARNLTLLRSMQS